MRALVAYVGIAVVAAILAASAHAEASTVWSAWTASPVAVDAGALPPLEREALAQCGRGDAGLMETARSVALRKVAGTPPESDEIARLQRAAGEPHPWARAWVASGRAPDVSQALARLGAWVAGSAGSAGSGGGAALRRCGVASSLGADGTTVLAVVAVDALADLAPLPTRARPGEWVTIEAHLRVAASAADVIALGPTGPPRRLPASLQGSTLRARFAPDRPGEFVLQVVADVGGGPRPVLEATLFAGVEPGATDLTRPAPGEDASDERDGADAGAHRGANEADGLARKLARARESVGLTALVRDVRLDAVAQGHAQRMADSHLLAHDVGDGDPVSRLRAAAVDASFVGENVAHAANLVLAHRSLWASPSHRLNLLRPWLDRVGVGVARDEQGQVWVVELFVRD